MIVQHLGSLHPLEQALTIVLAFGPFVVLGIVIAVRRRAERDERDERDEETQDDSRSRETP